METKDKLLGNLERKIGKTREKVRRIMEEYPETRDNYNLLLYRYWFGDRDKVFLDVSDFINMTSANTIGRARRHIQRKYPHLRGKEYLKRKLQEEEFRNYYRSNENLDVR